MHYLSVPNGHALTIEFTEGQACAWFDRGLVLLDSPPAKVPGYSVIGINVPEWMLAPATKWDAKVATQEDPQPEDTDAEITLGVKKLALVGFSGVPFAPRVLLPAISVP